MLILFTYREKYEPTFSTFLQTQSLIEKYLLVIAHVYSLNLFMLQFPTHLPIHSRNVPPEVPCPVLASEELGVPHGWLHLAIY